MYRYISLAKTKVLPAVVAAIFVAGTAFLSSAAAQKMIHVAISPQSQKSEKKNSLKVAQAIVADAGTDPVAGAEGESGQVIRTASAGAVLAAVTASANQGDTITSNSTVASTTAQTVNSSGIGEGQSNASASSQTNASATSANSTATLNNANSGASAGNVFTLQALSQHNKAGDCYIAYKGTVYDLSNVAAWANCQHHGATGGIDVTSMFPHPVSYFNSVPVIGTLGTAATVSGQTTSSATSQSGQAAASSGITTNTNTSLTIGSQASGLSGSNADSGNIGSPATSRSGWTDDDGLPKSQTNFSRQSRYDDDESDD